MQNQILLEIKNLKKYFPVISDFFQSRSDDIVKAVDNISFFIKTGETLGLVGESGCGKTTAARLILRLIESTDGEIIFQGKNITCFTKSQLKSLRKKIQIVFQDPYASLNPRMTVGEIISEPLLIHNLAKGKVVLSKAQELLELVGLEKSYFNRYPHEFSGGQRQRIGIARALAVNPEFIVCDEPVSSLDVSVQAQIINLLQDLQEKFNLTYLFISHDLAVIKHISHRIAVMYLGKIMEIADSEELYSNPGHPYTKLLLDAVPVPDPEIEKKRSSFIVREEISGVFNLPAGCRFQSRCRHKEEICKTQEPASREIGKNHLVACHLAEKLMVNSRCFPPRGENS